MITAGEYKGWLNLPVTQDFIRSLLDERTEMIEALLSTDGNNAEQLKGKIKCIDLIMFKFKDIKQKKDEEAANA